MTSDGDRILELILRRRSIREGYLDREVPHEILERVVACGLSGPSSKGANPVRLTVVTDRARLMHLADLMRSAPNGNFFTPHDPRTGLAHPTWESSVSQSADVLASAAAAVFVANSGPFSGGRRSFLEAEPRARELALIGFELELAGMGAALENMWLAANAQGLAAAFLGDVGVAETSIQRELGPTGDLLGALVLGYTDTTRQVTRPSLDPSSVRWDG